MNWRMPAIAIIPARKNKARKIISELNFFAKAIAENVDVFFSQDYPLRLDYKALDKVSLSFILAPRVEND